MRIIGTFLDYKKHVPKEWREANSHFDNAIETYLDMGGVLKVDDGLIPKLVYPSRARLNYQLDDTKRKKGYVDTQIRNLERKKRSYLANNFFTSVSRFVDPLYWEHTYRLNTDKDYKKSVNIVQPPVDLLRDVKWRKTVKMFVKSPDYRERLKEARTSIIGKKRRSINETAHHSLDENRKTIDNRLNGLREDREKFYKRINSLTTLMGWAKN